MSEINRLLEDLKSAGVRLAFTPTGFVYATAGEIDQRLLLRIQAHADELRSLLAPAPGSVEDIIAAAQRRHDFASFYAAVVGWHGSRN